jgi:hypothetical protein
MLNVSSVNHLKQTGNTSRKAHPFIAKIKLDAITPIEILNAIRSRGNLFSLLNLMESDPAGSVTLSRMRALNSLGNRTLAASLRKLVNDPMPRKGSSRLSNAQQIGFLDLIRKPERDRTKGDLFEAGVLTRDDFNHLAMDYIKSNEFLHQWLKTGYVHDDRIESWYSINLAHADFMGAFLGLSPDRSPCVEDVDFSDCDMRGASLDGISFYNCNLLHANLEDATMYDGKLIDCNGQRGNDRLVVDQLREQGLKGLYWKAHNLSHSQ